MSAAAAASPRPGTLLRRLVRRPEVAVAVLALCAMLVIGGINPAFWDAGNIFSLLRANVVTGIFALGVMVVMLSGGIDVSFPAFAVAAILTIKMMIAWQVGGVVLPFVAATGIGLLLGLVNAFFVYRLRMIPLIVTLGTGTAVRGLLLGAVGASQINIDRMPPALIGFARTELARVTLGNGQTVGLSAMVLVYLLMAVSVHLLLRYTLIGRSIYALGGGEEAARRVGFNVPVTTAFIYGLAGALAGFGGLLHGSMIWVANPRDLVGVELDVIAAVVLGGASIFGGRGSVLGTMLGVFTLVMLTNSLIIMHIDTTWQRIVTGAVVIVAAAATSWRDRRRTG